LDAQSRKPPDPPPPGPLDVGAHSQYSPQDLPHCFCFNVPEIEVIDTIKRHMPTTLAELLDLTQAGHGCGSCRHGSQDLLNQYWAGKPMGYKMPEIKLPNVPSAPQAPMEIPNPD